MNSQESTRERLIKILESEKMNAKTFATEVGIQAGTISNIMAGRNNPSLDVMQRVLARFRNISTDWLIMGQGEMYRSQESLLAEFERRQLSLFEDDEVSVKGDTVPVTIDSAPITSESTALSERKAVEQTAKKEAETTSVSASALASSVSASALQPARVLTRIVLFYSDGTFEER